MAIQEAGAESLPIVSLISFLIGMIFAFVGVRQLEQFGAGIYVADLVAVAMVREMAPIMTAIIMAGRTGAAYAAGLGTMKVNEEIDALSSMGVNPIDFLVLPRLVALVRHDAAADPLRQPARHPRRRRREPRRCWT